ncbi:MAG: hypothetical protein BroJett018_32990 [Chloroflexota bacterium]|nr:MAG: hypothetical protein BroJett018_32990 [Chloroflexota bacterium]
MLRSVEGIYRNGKIELAEIPDELDENTEVMVIFVPKQRFDLASIGMTREEAAEMRAQMESFIEDWDDPRMDIYNDYDANKA